MGSRLPTGSDKTGSLPYLSFSIIIYIVCQIASKDCVAFNSSSIPHGRAWHGQAHKGPEIKSLPWLKGYFTYPDHYGAICMQHCLCAVDSAARSDASSTGYVLLISLFDVLLVLLLVLLAMCY